jgi:hypothetical protein
MKKRKGARSLIGTGRGGLKEGNRALRERRWQAAANGDGTLARRRCREIGEAAKWTGPVAQYLFLFIQMFSNGFEFEPVKRWHSGVGKFSNKIWN